MMLLFSCCAPWYAWEVELTCYDLVIGRRLEVLNGSRRCLI